MNYRKKKYPKGSLLAASPAYSGKSLHVLLDSGTHRIPLGRSDRETSILRSGSATPQGLTEYWKDKLKVVLPMAFTEGKV